MKSMMCSASVPVLALAAAILAAPSAVLAADNDHAAAPNVSEVVVTAQKTAQRLQDVPLSVSAVTSKEIERRDITRLEDMQFSIPGLSSFEYGPGREFIQIRGIASTLSAPTIGNFVDEMPITGDTVGSTVDVRLYDMERVEVLRGPQGTLYGEGSMGGTIRYITADPRLDAFSGRIEGELGSVTDGGTSYKADGMVNIPIVTDKLGLRLVAGYSRDGGWIDNASTGEKDINPVTTKTIRGKLLIAPTDATKISLLVLHQETEQPNQHFAVDRVTSATVDTFNNNKYTLLNGVLNQDIGSVKLVESLGYLHSSTQTAFDLTPFYLPVLEAPPPFGFGVPHGLITQIPYPADIRQKIFTNETRLSSNGEGPFNWTAGFYYRHATMDETANAYTAPYAFPIPLLDATLGYDNTSYAVFGEANYQLTDKLNALVGLRYFHDHRIFDSDSASFGFPAVDHGDGNFHSVDPRFNIRYEFSPTSMVYVNVAKGFRSGGFNLTSAGGGVFTVPPTYDPETLWTYEAGTKHQLFDRKLEIEGAVYYSDWSDVQSYLFAPGSAIIITENGGKVTGWGFDGSATIHAAPGLTLSGTYSWNNLAYDQATADKDVGDPIDFAVHNSASASLDYRRPLTATVDGFFRADYQHAGKAQITLRNFGGQIIHVPARDLVNLRVGLDVGKVELSLFANNVFDNSKPVIPGPFGVISENVEQRPRVIGVNVQASF
jgi:outer membrane receptor protein involved in Fe transport